MQRCALGYLGVEQVSPANLGKEIWFSGKIMEKRYFTFRSLVAGLEGYFKWIDETI